jgi:hypothetical protein
MTELRVHNLSISLDGFAAGPTRDVDHPLGVGGTRLHEWVFPEGRDRTAVDEAFIARGEDGIGRKHLPPPPLAGSRRAPEGGEEPSRRLRPDPPPTAAIARGRRHHVPLRDRRDRRRAGNGPGGAAGGQAVRLGGGVATIAQYLRAGLLDELGLAVVPVLLGGGERLYDGLGDALGNWACVEYAPSETVAHVRLRRQ